MEQPALQVAIAAALRAGHVEAVRALHGPAAHHRERQLRMELHGQRRAIREGLVGVGLASREERRATGQVEALRVPLIGHGGPARGEVAPRLRRVQRVPADLGIAVVARRDAAPERAHEHLRAQADAEGRQLRLQRAGEQVRLGGDVGLVVVRAHRSAEHDEAGIGREVARQGAAESGAPDLEPVSARAQDLADPSRSGRFLMKDGQDRPRPCERRGVRGPNGGGHVHRGTPLSDPGRG